MTNATHVLPFRRKQEGRTNYKKRLALLKSGKPRLIIRRTNKHLLLQLASYHQDGDLVICSVDSKSLAKHGWTHATKSVPACYFTGVLLAKVAQEHKITEAIVDIGLQQHRAGTRICAAIAGAIAGGLSIPASEEIFPSAERIAGKHISPDVEKDVAALAAKLGVKLPAIVPHEKKAEKKVENKAVEKKGEKPAKAEHHGEKRDEKAQKGAKTQKSTPKDASDEE
jgi:large subunit ribosomal protein L18